MNYYIGSVDAPAGKNGWLIGAFLEKNHPCFSEAVEVAWKKLGPDSRDPKHIHEHPVLEISVVIKGSLVEVIDGQRLTLGAGNYVIVRPSASVEVLGAEEETIVLVIKVPSEPENKHIC